MAQLRQPRHPFNAGVGSTLGWVGYWLRSRTRNALREQERAWEERDALIVKRPQEGTGLPYLGRHVVPSLAGS